MKAIKPITIWKNGESQEANLLNAYIVNDDLKTYCSFQYSLNSRGEGTDTITLADGTITMSGDQYLAWDNSNEAAFFYIAKQLNLTLI